MHQQGVALVPIPSSKARTDPLYDPRMRVILDRVANNLSLQLDIRDCLSFSGQYAASHLAAHRPSADELYADLTFDPVAGRHDQRPLGILLFDDVLTRGAHFAAATTKLRDAFGDVPIYGCFISRTVIPNPFAGFGIQDID
jgi:predicted amidophosphoribosyltransferase